MKTKFLKSFSIIACGLLALGLAACSTESYSPATPSSQSHSHFYTGTIIPATCTELGFIVYTCECGDSYSEIYENIVGHSFTDYTSNGDATCTEYGTKQPFAIEMAVKKPIL